jgi:hypothetical protein
MTRQEITAEAKQQIEKRIMKEAEERGEMDRSERKEVEEEMEEEENEEIKKAWKRVPLLPKKLLGKGEDHREPSLPQESKRSTDPSRSRNSLDSSRKSNADRNIQPSHQASRKSTHREKRSVIGSSSAPIGPATSSDSSGTKLGTKSVAQSSVPPPQAVLEKPSLPKATERKDDEPKEGKREKIMKLIRKADMDLS